MIPLHHHIVRHASKLRSRVNCTRIVVSLGVVATMVLALHGMETWAVPVSIATNLVWIWE
jgi:hypothetical protein